MKFELEPAEREKFDAWWEAHKKAEHDGEEPYTGAIGGCVAFKIMHFSIGTGYSAECTVCKRKVTEEAIRSVLSSLERDDKVMDRYYVNLTDYSEW